MLVTAIAIKLDSKGPVLFKQKRHGFNNELIEVYKFRSMYTDRADADAAKLVTKDDPRVTRVGRFIRKTSIDELPQFFNVLQRSAVARRSAPACDRRPRPHNVLYYEAVEGYFARHKVKPGITGWAQINGWRGETDTLDKIMQRRQARPLLHRELVAAARPLHPGHDAGLAVRARRERLLRASGASWPLADVRPLPLPAERARGPPMSRASAGLLDSMVAVWIFMGGIVIIEPSPYELVFVLVLAAGAVRRHEVYRSTLGLLPAAAAFIPFAIIAAFQATFTPVTTTLIFEVVTIFLLLTCFFVANYVAERAAGADAAASCRPIPPSR